MLLSSLYICFLLVKSLIRMKLNRKFICHPFFSIHKLCVQIFLTIFLSICISLIEMIHYTYNIYTGTNPGMNSMGVHQKLNDPRIDAPTLILVWSKVEPMIHQLGL
jgi:hypothetical protein